MLRNRQLILAIAFVVGVNLAFLLSFWNRFLAPSVSGMFLEFAALMLRGEVPYRDFYVIVTPFYIFKTAIIVKTFGLSLVALRLSDLILRCVLGAVFLIWLAKIVRVRYALLATLASVTFFSMDSAESLTSYHLEGVFWAVVGGFVLSFVNWERKLESKNGLLISSAGFCCSVCFFTKQTSGAGITLALLIVIASLPVRRFGCTDAIRRIALFCGGWAVPAAVLLLWLQKKGALPAFLNIVFWSGHTAKGPARVVLLRVFDFPLSAPAPLKIILLSFAVISLMLVFQIVQRGSTDSSQNGSVLQLVAIGGAGFIALVIGHAFCDFFGRDGEARALLEILSIQFGFLGTLAFALGYAIALARRSLDRVETQRWIMSLSSLLIYYTLSWSWGLWRPMAFPCLAVVIAFSLEELALARTGSILRYLIAAHVMLLLTIFEASKVLSPFEWEKWSDAPVYKATSTSGQPVLRGIHLPLEVADFADQLTQIIQTHSRPGEPIFIYSYQPIWYVLADRYPPTYAQVHFFDVAPDDICRLDADRLVETHPKVIVDFTSDRDLTLGEEEFRKGQASGQRYLYSRMYQLIATDYRLERIFKIPEVSEPVKVFVVRDTH